MSDLISRQDAIDAIERSGLTDDPCDTAIRLIEALPSAERKKGKWVNDIAYYDEDGCPCIVTRCTWCGEASPISDFCPNCGARMVSEDGNN